MHLTHKASFGLEEEEHTLKCPQTRKASVLRNPVFASLCALITLPVLSVPCAAQQFPFTVSASANIFGAGYGDAPAPGGYGGGTIAPSISFAPSAGQYLTLTTVSGSVSYSGGESNGPNGGPQAFYAENYRSLSGISDPHAVFYLLGVFTNETPSGTPPPQFDFSDKSAASYQPLLNQVFFIGDGLTGTSIGSVQKFFAPAGATKLTLGFADADSQGNIGSYRDNSGQLICQATVISTAAVPEASTLVSTSLLLALGLGGLAWNARRRKAQAAE